jgi:predicted dehydrogenase
MSAHTESTPTAVSSLTAGVVGTGFMGVAHTEALRRLGVHVKGIVGSTPERARAKAAMTSLPPVFDSLEELLADPDIDVIHITTPNHLHHVQVAAVLDAGKHVLCEKPLAVSVAEGRDLEARALRAGVRHAVCFNQRYYPLVHQAREMVASGELGTVRLVSGGYLQDWLLFDTDWNWRLVAEKGGELRAVADIGSHWFDNVEFITGARIESVMADLHTFHHERTHPTGEVETFAAHQVGDVERVTEAIASDDAAGVLLRFDSGARGAATISQVSAGRKNFLNWEIDCAQTAISWNTENPENLWVGHRGEPNQILKRDPGMMHPAAAATTSYPSGHVEGYPDTFKALFADFYAHIASGGVGVAKYPTFAAGVRSLMVCDAVAQSARTSAWAYVTA